MSSYDISSKNENLLIGFTFSALVHVFLFYQIYQHLHSERPAPERKIYSVTLDSSFKVGGIAQAADPKDVKQRLNSEPPQKVAAAVATEKPAEETKEAVKPVLEVVKVPEKKKEIKPEVKVEKKPDPKPEVRKEPAKDILKIKEKTEPKPEVKPKPEPKPEPKQKPQPDPKPEPKKAEPAPEATADPVKKTVPDTEVAKPEPQAKKPTEKAAAQKPASKSTAPAKPNYQDALQKYLGNSTDAGGSGFGSAGTGGTNGTGGGELRTPEWFRYTALLESQIRRSWNWHDNRQNLVGEVAFSLKADGSLTSIRVFKSSGNRLFDDSMLRAAQKANPVSAPSAALYEQYKSDFSDIVVDFKTDSY